MQCHYNTVIDSSGNAINGAAVSVYKTDLVTLATIYSDDGVTVTANPIICDSLGRFSFYAGNGKYALKISGAGITTYWIKGVCLFDPSNILPPTNLTLINSFVSVYLIPMITRSGDTVNISGTMKGGVNATIFTVIPAIHQPINGSLDFIALNSTTGVGLTITASGNNLYIYGVFSTTDIIFYGLSYLAQPII